MRRFHLPGGALEWSLALALVALAVQMFPDSVLYAFSGLDVRNWSRGGLLLLNVCLLMALLGARFGGEGWNYLARSAGSRPASETRPVRASRERVDPRVGVAREERERSIRRRRTLTRGVIVVGVFSGIATLGWGALLLIPNSAPPQTLEPLFRNHPGRLDHCTGTVAGYFKVRSDEDVLLTHLGFFDAENDGLQVSHPVGVFELSSTNPVEGRLVAEVIIPYGTSAFLEEGYRWIALTDEVKLKAGKSYLLGAHVGEGSPDPVPRWQSTSEEIVRPQWNPSFIGQEAEATRRATWTPEPWPTVPIHIDTPDDSGTTFGAANAAFKKEASNGLAK